MASNATGVHTQNVDGIWSNEIIPGFHLFFGCWSLFIFMDLWGVSSPCFPIASDLSDSKNWVYYPSSSALRLNFSNINKQTGSQEISSSAGPPPWQPSRTSPLLQYARSEPDSALATRRSPPRPEILGSEKDDPWNIIFHDGWTANNQKVIKQL